MMGRILYIFIFVLFSGISLADTWKEKKVIAKIDKDGVQRVKIKAGSYYYDPNYIVVKKDIPVELILIRESAVVPHNIVLEMPGIKIKEEIYPDKEVRIRFVPKSVGRYIFYCDKKFLFFPRHSEKGMWGILEVVE